MKRFSRTSKIVVALAIVILPGAVWTYWNHAKVSTSKFTVPAEYQGIWQQVGYGKVFSITNHGGAYFEHTRQTCIKVDKLDKSDIARLIDTTEFSDDRNTLRVIPDAFELFDSTIIKLDTLPAVCQADNLIVADTPTVTFEHLWHTFNDYYAFFVERNIDWNNQYTKISPMVTDDMSDDDLLDVFSALLSPIDDGHIQLITDDDDFDFTSTRDAEKYVVDSFPKQTEHKDVDEYIEALLTQWRAIRHSYFDSAVEGSAGGSSGAEVEWAASESNVGYLYIGTMEELANNGSDSPTESLQAINRIMKKALADLNHTDALIIDVRFNGGGLDAVSLAIANHFTDQPGLAYSKYDRNFAGDIDTVDAFFSPATETPYLKPVVILASEGTASAAEVFLIMMSGLPHVTLMGENSEGILADSEFKSLPNKWMIGVPNVVFMDTKGRKYEVIGVPPEIDAPTNLPKIFESKKDAAIEAALVALGY